MKLDVVDLYTPVCLCRICILDEEFIVDSKLALRHSRELSFHHDLPENVSLQDSPSQ
jgi:hypothetical protein